MGPWLLALFIFVVCGSGKCRCWLQLRRSGFPQELKAVLAGFAGGDWASEPHCNSGGVFGYDPDQAGMGNA